MSRPSRFCSTNAILSLLLFTSTLVLVLHANIHAHIDEHGNHHSECSCGTPDEEVIPPPTLANHPPVVPTTSRAHPTSSTSRLSIHDKTTQRTTGNGQIVLNILDTAPNGFYNPTYGPDRIAAAEYVADYWTTRLRPRVNITVGIQFTALTCSPTSATLGNAGPNLLYIDGNNQLIPAALADQIVGVNLDPSSVEINANFNKDLDEDPTCLGGLGWDYTLDCSGTGICFIETLKHEFVHGFGFVSLYNTDGSPFAGYHSRYGSLMYYEQTQQTWTQMTSNAQRLTSGLSVVNLTFATPTITNDDLSNGFDPDSGHVRIYAPSSYAPGSSWSHFDTSVQYDDGAHELMEPFLESSIKDTKTLQFLCAFGYDYPCNYDLNISYSWTFTQTVMLSNGTCGVNDVSSLAADAGPNITFCYHIVNNGIETLTETVIIDDNATPADPTDDHNITVSSSIAPGVSIYVTRETNQLDYPNSWTFSATATLENMQPFYTDIIKSGSAQVTLSDPYVNNPCTCSVKPPGGACYEPSGVPNECLIRQCNAGFVCDAFGTESCNRSLIRVLKPVCDPYDGGTKVCCEFQTSVGIVI